MRGRPSISDAEAAEDALILAKRRPTEPTWKRELVAQVNDRLAKLRAKLNRTSGYDVDETCLQVLALRELASRLEALDVPEPHVIVPTGTTKEEQAIAIASVIAPEGWRDRHGKLIRAIADAAIDTALVSKFDDRKIMQTLAREANFLWSTIQEAETQAVEAAASLRRAAYDSAAA